MKNARVLDGERLNELEMFLVDQHMEKIRPNMPYTMSPGNDCIWVWFGNQNWYFIFREGRIADIQID